MGDSVLSLLRAQPPGEVPVLFPKTGYRLHAMVTSAGYDRRADGAYSWHGLRRGNTPFVLLQHSIAGRGRLRFGTRGYEVRPGQTMLLRFPHDNRYWLPAGEHWEFFWLCLSGREVLRVWRDAMAACGPVVQLGEATVERLAGLCLSVLRGEVNSAAPASSLAYSAAMCVVGDLLPGRGIPAGSHRPEAIERVISLSQARATEGLDVAGMAAAAGYSRHHFSRLFAATEGVSPGRYLLHLRLEGAVQLLRTSQLPIKVVAERCGFNDSNYFGKVFRRAFGVGPRAFRHSGKYAASLGGVPPGQAR